MTMSKSLVSLKETISNDLAKKKPLFRGFFISDVYSLELISQFNTYPS